MRKTETMPASSVPKESMDLVETEKHPEVGGHVKKSGFDNLGIWATILRFKKVQTASSSTLAALPD